MKKKIVPISEEATKVEKPKDTAATPPQPPPKPAELDQDPGGGYNPDHTFPQT